MFFGAGFGAICPRLPDADSGGFIARRRRQETLQGIFLKFPLDVLTLRVGRWETKDDLSTVKTGAETTGERGSGGGGAAIFDRVREENANESRSETIEWLEKTTVLSLVSITKRLRPRCVKFGELTELPDV